MITTVSLSPAIDKRLEFDGFAKGQTNRVVSMHAEAAGKAVDVALSARALGMDVRCIGLLAAHGEMLTARLDSLDVPYDFLPAPGTVRTNQKLFDRQTGEITEVNEPVPEAPRMLLDAAADAAVMAARRSDYLVLTGSLPTACPPDWYARVIARVQREAPSCRCVLDAEGERLALGAMMRPWLVKPNLYELSLLAGDKLTTRGAILGAARSLLARGPEIVVVSLGSEGAVAVTGREAYIGQAVPLETVKTTTGAGDAMVAGLLHGFAQGAGLGDALRHGLASAAARCAYAGERYIDGALFERSLPLATVEKIAL